MHIKVTLASLMQVLDPRCGSNEINMVKTILYTFHTSSYTCSFRWFSWQQRQVILHNRLCPKCIEGRKGSCTHSLTWSKHYNNNLKGVQIIMLIWATFTTSFPYVIDDIINCACMYTTWTTCKWFLPWLFTTTSPAIVISIHNQLGCHLISKREAPMYISYSMERPIDNWRQSADTYTCMQPRLSTTVVSLASAHTCMHAPHIKGPMNMRSCFHNP